MTSTEYLEVKIRLTVPIVMGHQISSWMRLVSQTSQQFISPNGNPSRSRRMCSLIMHHIEIRFSTAVSAALDLPVADARDRPLEGQTSRMCSSCGFLGCKAYCSLSAEMRDCIVVGI